MRKITIVNPVSFCLCTSLFLINISTNLSWAFDETESKNIPKTNFLIQTNDMPMVYISGGEVKVATYKEYSRNFVSTITHTIIVPYEYWIGKYEVTIAEYYSMVKENDERKNKKGKYPIVNVSWLDAMLFCDQLNAAEKSKGRLPKGYQYRLPIEKEWEYACRAGTSTPFSFGPDVRDINLYGKTADNAMESSPSEVGSYLPNPWGLHDMHGNVSEYCLNPLSQPEGLQDSYSPSVILEDKVKFTKGGSFDTGVYACTSDSSGCRHRDYGTRDIGFRVVLAPEIENYGNLIAGVRDAKNKSTEVTVSRIIDHLTFIYTKVVLQAMRLRIKLDEKGLREIYEQVCLKGNQEARYYVLTDYNDYARDQVMYKRLKSNGTVVLASRNGAKKAKIRFKNICEALEKNSDGQRIVKMFPDDNIVYKGIDYSYSFTPKVPHIKDGIIVFILTKEFLDAGVVPAEKPIRGEK